MYVLETIFKLVLANTMIRHPLDFILSSSKLSCVNMCLSVSWCVAVSYSKDSRNCTRSNTRYMITDSVNLAPASGWQYYQMFPDSCPVNSKYTLARQPIGLCYRIYDYMKVIQLTGKSVCEKDGGSLIKLDTLEKNVHIKDVVKTYNALIPYYYIGAEETTPGVWTWSDGSVLNFSDWGPTEPDHLKAETCVVLVKSDGFRWANVFCDLGHQFICEKYLF